MKLLRSAVRFTPRALLLLACATLPLAAITKPPASIAKRQLGRMVDARVNLNEAFAAATKARSAELNSGLATMRRESRSMNVARAELKRAVPGLEVQVSGFTGAPEVVRNKGGALTGINPGLGNEAIVREFLNRHGAVYGLGAADLNDLVVLGDSAGGKDNLRMLRMEQRINGRPVFQSETRYVLDRDGRLYETLGRMVPGARSHVSRFKAGGSLSAAQAVVQLLASENHTATAASFSEIARRGDGYIELSENDDLVAGTVYARQVLFPLAPGLLVPAWSLVVFTEGEADWYGLVDEESGALLWRKNIRNYVSTHQARFRVYVQADGKTPADSPAPQSPSGAAPGGNTQFPEIAPTIVSMLTAQDIVASPNGWIDDCPGGGCTANETQTLGNNVLACVDRGAPANTCDTDAAGVLDGNGRPTGNPDANTRNRDFLGTAPRDFQTGFLPAPQGGNAEAGQTATGAGASGANAFDQFRRGSVTQQFYATNWYHDQMFQLGFDEASGNFQQVNFSGMGLGGDRVLVDVQDGSGTNNANFATPPDGVSGRAQMFRFTGPTIDRDGGLDAEILLHELTHGTSNRLVGNGAGLNWDPAGGLGEGWSDFVALSLLNNTNADNPAGNYASGGYATFKLGGLQDNYVYGIRRFPYSTNNSVNPMTWADVDDFTNSLTGGIAADPLGFNFNGGMEVHNSGEIWALTLWEVRSRIIADPAGANGDVPTGNVTALRIVTNAMKLTPIDPTFTQARDALLTSDCALFACANEMSIWGGFADRGLGYGSKAPFNVLFGFTAGHLGIKESFVSPFLDVVNPATDVAVSDASGNNNGNIDPGEPITMTVTLTNPWRGASKAVASATAVLSTSTPGVTITDANSTYGAIAPQGTATGDSFAFTVSGAALCGSAIDFTITTTSSLGTTAASFRVRIGAASGTDPVVTYTKNTAPDLAIPDATPLAVSDTLSITDDFQIADLDFRLDSATHTFTGDLTFMLRSPGGLGLDQIALIGALDDGGSGDNIANMLIDSDAAQTAANDMVQVTAAGAPYTKTWVPTFDGPWPVIAGFPAKNPATKDLDIYDGTSTLGTWSVSASDQFVADTGTLNQWSILVTPVHFVCQGFTPTTTVTATKAVSGTFTVGGTVTYTVVLTNTGNTAQADNAGNEFLDDLPASLSLTNATATSGTATSNVVPNQVTWNGTIPANGGTVTITITATVLPAGAGQNKCNQGSASFDADVNGSNESTVLTDDPGLGGATDPTCFAVAGTPNLSVTKTASGTFTNGSVVTYTIVITNSGTAASPDNAGDELTDTLPAGLTGISASASAGTITSAPGANPVTWSGSVPGSGGTVTITIQATINAVPGTVLSNQATVAYDADGNGSNETTVQSDDPVPGGATDPTQITVAGVTIPTLDEVGLAILALALMSAAWFVLRKRKLTA